MSGTHGTPRVARPNVIRVAENKKDKTLKRTFKHEREARERILAWLIEGAVRYFAEGLEDVPREVERGNNEYRREQNPLYLFIEDYCVEDREAGRDYKADLCTVERFVAEFNHVRGEYAAEELSAKSFGRLMRPLRYEQWRDGKKRGYIGIRVKTLDEQDADIGFYEYQDDLDMQVEALSRFAFVTFDVWKAYFPYNACKKEESCTSMWKNGDLNVKRQNLGEGGRANSRELDQDALSNHIHAILVDAKNTGMWIDNDSDQLAQATATKIKQQHPEFSEYPVEEFYKKLLEGDTELQGLIADLTGGRRAADNAGPGA